MTKLGLPDTYKVIPDEHYAAIGRAVATWNDLEFAIDRAVWKLLDKEQAVGACITAQYTSIFSRLNALICLISLFGLSEDASKGLKKLQGTLSSLNEQRNRIVHDVRFKRGRDQTIGRYEVTAKSTLTIGWQLETVEDLEQFCRSVDLKRREFFKLWRLVLEKVEAAPQMLQQRFARIVLSDLEELETEPQEDPLTPDPQHDQ
jgi:hypothetical protein